MTDEQLAEIDAAVQAEREACAALCDAEAERLAGKAVEWDVRPFGDVGGMASKWRKASAVMRTMAAAIRKRGEA